MIVNLIFLCKLYVINIYKRNNNSCFQIISEICMRAASISLIIYACNYSKWPINCPGRLFKSKSFWMEACSDWVTKWTSALIKKMKKNKTNKKSLQSKFSQKLQLQFCKQNYTALSMCHSASRIKIENKGLVAYLEPIQSCTIDIFCKNG